MQDARTPLHLFLLSHHPNFPDVAVTRNKQLNEHLSAGDSFSPCEGLYRGCRREDSPLPWTACNDVKFTEAKKSLLFSLKQQEPTSAAPHLKYMWQKGHPGHGFQLHQGSELPAFPADAWVGVDIRSGFTFYL